MTDLNWYLSVIIIFYLLGTLTNSKPNLLHDRSNLLLIYYNPILSVRNSNKLETKYNLVLVGYPCVATVDGSQQYSRKLSTKKISIFFISCLHSLHNIFYERTGTIDSKLETSIPRFPYFQGFVEQQGKGRGGHTCSLSEKDMMKT
jgi:hypothetical protein